MSRNSPHGLSAVGSGPDPDHSRGIRLFWMLGGLVFLLALGGVIATAVIVHRNAAAILRSNLVAQASDSAVYGARLAADAVLTQDVYQAFVLVDGMVRNRPRTWRGAGVWRTDGQVLARSQSFPDEMTADLEALIAESATMSANRHERYPWGGVVIAPVHVGPDRVGSFAVLYGTGDAEENLASVNRAVIALGGVLLVFALVLALPMALGITRPIRKLEAVVNRVEKGELAVNADEGAWGEAGSLAHGFNRMMAKIRDLLDEVREAEADAQQARNLATLAQLGGGLAHEIKNPLTSVNLLLDHVLSGATGMGTISLPREDLEVLSSQIGKIDDVLNEFINFARPRPLKRSPMNLGERMSKVLRSLKLEADETGVSLIRAEGDDVTVLADSGKVEQAVVNLIRNALAHTPRGAAVTVGWGKTPAGWTLWVQDEGPGVPEDLKEKIFDPFFTSRDSGLGLGLAIARSAAQQNGGTLSVVDVPDGGARFEIRVPDAPAEAG